MDQPTAAPTNKVTAAAIGGAVAALVVWIIQVVADVQAPPGIEAAIATLVAVTAGYLIPNDQV